MNRDRIAEHTPPWSDDGDTPAPWVFDDTDNEMAIVRDANGGVVASCTDGFYNDSGDWVMAAKCAPVARLIKSAPALLAALEAFVSLADDDVLTIVADQAASYDTDLVLTISNGRAAIAAARGQQ